MSSRLGWLFFIVKINEWVFSGRVREERGHPAPTKDRPVKHPLLNRILKNSTPASPESLFGFLWRTYDILLSCPGLPTIRNKLFSLSVCRELLLCIELVVVTRFEETVLIKTFILEPLSIISTCPVCMVVRKLARRWHTFPTTSLWSILVARFLTRYTKQINKLGNRFQLRTYRKYKKNRHYLQIKVLTLQALLLSFYTFRKIPVSKNKTNLIPNMLTHTWNYKKSIVVSTSL